MKRVLGAVTVAVVAVALLGGGAARAATLKELLEAADQQNVDLRITQAQRERSAAEMMQAWTSLGPAVTAQGQFTHNEKAIVLQFDPRAPGAVIRPHNSWDGSVRLDLPLVNVAQWFRILAADAASAAAESRVDSTRDAIRRQVSATYFGYAAALAVRQSAERTANVAKAQLHLQQVRADAGAATQLEVMRARAELERSLQVISDTSAAVANTRRALLTLTGMDPGDTAPIPAEDLEPEGTLEALEARVDELPALKAARSDAEAAARQAVAARMAYAPVVVGSATETLTSQTTALNPNPNFGSVGIGLQWRLDLPTWFGGNAAAAQASAARLAVERTRLLARDQVHTDYQRLKTAIEKLSASKAQVEAAQQAAKISQDRYELGAATQLDVIQAERDLFAAEVNQIQAQTELASSHIALRLSAGLPLGL